VQGDTSSRSKQLLPSSRAVTADVSSSKAAAASQHGFHHYYDNDVPQPQSPYAYAFVLTGISQEPPQRYKGFLYNILVATRILREQGSKADVVVLVQLHYYEDTNTAAKQQPQQLPQEDVRWLQRSNIRLRYIAPSPHESFYETVVDHKFRILQLTEYRRVMLLDADVLPLTNLDYLLEWSDDSAGILKPNVILAGRSEPAHGALFVLAPHPGAWERVQAIVRRREEGAYHTLKQQQHKFDERLGWGHVIPTHDPWKARRDPGSDRWNFRYAFADQGLLYHYTKYVEQNVSILFGTERVENWGSSSNNGSIEEPRLEQVLYRPFEKHYRTTTRRPLVRSDFLCQFYCDVAHFGGNAKPWMRALPAGIDLAQPVDRSASGSVAVRIWWHTLYQLNQEFQMGLDLKHWDETKQTPLLGMYPTYKDMDERVKRRAFASPLSSPSTNMSKYAVCYVIGGCDPANLRYRGFVYNILVSTRVLREEGSLVDVVAMFQMSYESGASTLPDEDVQWLEAMGVKIRYIPPSPSESFYDTVMDKFRIVSLTQYRRVLLLDGDVMPVANVDFLFELSDGPNAVLKESVVVRGPFEPANGGLFMLTPREGEWERIQEIVRKREESAANIPNGEGRRKFDEDTGWGHQIQPHDEWKTRYTLKWMEGEEKETIGLKWNFHFAYSDQGLLYHYVKYVRKNVSIMSGYGGTTVENWHEAPDGTSVLENTIELPLQELSHPRINMHIQCKKFLCEFSHFTANTKPWLRPPEKGTFDKKNKNKNAHIIWWQTLQSLNRDLQMGLDLENWKGREQPPLGMYAKFEDLDRRVNERAGKMS